MKKLLTFSTLLPLTIAAQGLDGINPEHLVISPSVSVEAIRDTQSIQLKTGVTLEYVEQGKAGSLPVVLLHGLSDTYHSFKPVLNRLPENVHVFAPTQRGHGNSEKPASGYSPKHFAADIAAFVEQLRLGPVIIAGHSMGGINALQFAIDYPHLVKGVMVIDSDPAFTANPGIKEFVTEIMQMDKMTREFMEVFQKSTIANPIDSVYLEEIINEGMKISMQVFQKICQETLTANLLDSIKNINKPVWVLWGDQDGVCLKPGQEAFARNLKKGKLIIYEGIGHALHWEAPERFVKDLMEFIQSIQEAKS